MPGDEKPPSTLDESLSRINTALSPGPPPPPARQDGPGARSAVLGVLGLALIIAGLETGHQLLLALGLLLAALGGGPFVLPQARRSLALLQGGPPSKTRASISLGATISAGAVIEPGASVEMGAVVRRGAIVRAGSVVRMGAVISRDAIVEKGALVSWGAVVNRGAVVGEQAIVGAGAVVRRDARVAPGMRLSPGAIYAAGQGPTAAMSRAAPSTALAAGTPHEVGNDASGSAAAADPRDLRLAAVCERLEAELKSAPEQVRAFLGGSDRTIASLRRTCEDLSRRERAMREEQAPQAIAQLDQERAALQGRAAHERDPQLSQSLQGAVAAIDELKRQRELLRLGADRLQAEHTRLLYTLEGLASQFVRLRSAGGAGGAGELEQGVLQLRAGIDAIAEALEEVSREAPAALRELATAPDAGLAADAPNPPDGRSRSR